jgi:hypothetical protein
MKVVMKLLDDRIDEDDDVNEALAIRRMAEAIVVVVADEWWYRPPCYQPDSLNSYFGAYVHYPCQSDEAAEGCGCEHGYGEQCREKMTEIRR